MLFPPFLSPSPLPPLSPLPIHPDRRFDPRRPSPSSYPSSAQNIIFIKKINGLRLLGSGSIDGQGWEWWAGYKAGNISFRPNLLRVDCCKDVIIEGITLL